MAAIQQSQAELENQLKEQIGFLRASADAYDEGTEAEAKRLAAVLRTLLHDTVRSRSLLGQLRKKNGLFYDTAANAEQFFTQGTRIGSFTSLAALATDGRGGSRYIPYFDESPPSSVAESSFTDYWNRIVFIDNQAKTFTREQIVLAVANQDGGAHVDPALDKKYHNLSRENSMGWKIGNKNSETKVELVAIRQIAHEILRKFDSTYPPNKRMPLQGMLMAMAPAIVVTRKGLVPPTVVRKRGYWQRVADKLRILRWGRN